MNDNDKKYGVNDNNVYRATSNLNTAIENPQFNMNSAVGVNIKDVELVSNTITDSNIQSFDDSNVNFSENVNNNFVDEKVNSNSSFIKSDNFDLNQNNGVDSSSLNNSNGGSEYVATSSKENVVYEPTMKDNKKHGVSIKITRELKVMIFIVFLLLLFILVIPYIYDFFKDMHLVITT